MEILLMLLALWIVLGGLKLPLANRWPRSGLPRKNRQGDSPDKRAKGGWTRKIFTFLLDKID